MIGMFSNGCRLIVKWQGKQATNGYGYDQSSAVFAMKTNTVDAFALFIF